ncbi:MAG: hypothetical protein ACLRMZ_22305 [Blautia marasmi]
MCEYLGYRCSLKRTNHGLTIDGLKEGGYREATREEWKKLERGAIPQLPAARGRTVRLYFQETGKRQHFLFLQFQKKRAK